MKLSLNRFLLLIGLPILLAACAEPATPDGTPPPPETARPLQPTAETPFTPNPRREDGTTYRVNQLLPFDGIRPIYDPDFSPADDVELVDDALVMGVAFDDAAKAYPVSVLAHREMVNDELRGIPILVTW